MGLNMRISLFMRRFCCNQVAFLTSLSRTSTEAPTCRILSTKAKPSIDVISNLPDTSTESSQTISIDRSNNSDRSLNRKPKGNETMRIDHMTDKSSVSRLQEDSFSDCFGKNNPEVNMEKMTQMAAEQLRCALQSWSVEEKAKAAATISGSKEFSSPQSLKLSEHTTDMHRILSTSSQLPSEGLFQGKVNTFTDVTVKNFTPDETQVLETMPDQKPQTSSMSSNAWIRNKRSKFWDIVFSVSSPSVASNSVGTNAPFSASTVTKALSQTNRLLSEKDPVNTSDLYQDERGVLYPPILPQENLSEVGGDLNQVNLSNAATYRVTSASKTSESDLRSSDTVSKGPSEGAHSGHSTRPKYSYIRNQHKKNVALRLAELLNCDPRLGYTILERLSDDSLRLLLVMGTANEYYGKDSYDIVKQVKAADKDCDSAISAKEYEEWAMKSWKYRQHHSTVDTVTEDALTAGDQKDREIRSQSSISTNSNEIILDSIQKNPPRSDPGYIPWPIYLRLLFNFSLPFMAFGILDNATLIIASDAVEHSLLETLSLTGLAAAGVGGIISGVAGIQVHSLAGRWTRITPPILTKAQSISRSYERSASIGNTFGIITGLVIGMIPLLFIRGDRDNEAEDNNRLRREEERIQEIERELHQEECT
ncbi:unnamed protein product [Phytomonas sp. Hart1]|nr:unnamed protein product [Phytomonas sp. Hart1]|eukprot:CCW68485.1 unnamed protein product [Phytomonas sp. isolate Hart1]